MDNPQSILDLIAQLYSQLAATQAQLAKLQAETATRTAK